MAKKRVIPVGTGTFVPKGAKIRLIQNNGVIQKYDRTARPSFVRKITPGSTIISETGDDGRFRPCSHAQEQYLAEPLTKLPAYIYGETNYTGPSDIRKCYIYELFEDVHQNRYSRFIAGCNSVNLSFSTVPWHSLGATALQAMLPTFTSDNSFVNYVLEFKDFKSIVKYNSARLIKTQTRMMNLFGIFKGDKPLAKLSKIYLSYSFGWRPLYRDLVSFFETISGFYRRWNELVRRANEPQQSYWGTWVAGTAAAASTYYDNGTGDGPNGGWIGPFLGKVRARVNLGATQGIRYHATVRYRYPLPPELLSVTGRLKAMLDVLGVNANPAILWNAIPFSFIVDWFVNVNAYLERLRMDNIQFKTEILDFCASARIERTIEYALAGESWTSAGGFQPQAFQTTDMCRKVLYERKLGLPNYLEALQSSGLNAREFSLAGALLGARGRR